MEGAVVVSGKQSGLPWLLTAAERAAPVDAVDVVAEDLRRRFETTKISFLIVDLTGKAVARLSTAIGAEDGREAERIPEAAHILAYVVIANGRFTDLYTWGKRSTPPTLAAEIQYQLLPPSLACEAAQFTLCGHLEPSEDLSGDTFDYSLDRDILHVSVTDPMGHDIDAALAATVLVGALRGARRAGAGLAEQAHRADQALASHGRGHATG